MSALQRWAHAAGEPGGDVEARAGFEPFVALDRAVAVDVRREVAVADHARQRVARQEAVNRGAQRLPLRGRVGVDADQADAEAAGVVLGVRADLGLLPRPVTTTPAR